MELQGNYVSEQIKLYEMGGGKWRNDMLMSRLLTRALVRWECLWSWRRRCGGISGPGAAWTHALGWGWGHTGGWWSGWCCRSNGHRYNTLPRPAQKKHKKAKPVRQNITTWCLLSLSCQSNILEKNISCQLVIEHQDSTLHTEVCCKLKNWIYKLTPQDQVWFGYLFLVLQEMGGLLDLRCFLWLSSPCCPGRTGMSRLLWRLPRHQRSAPQRICVERGEKILISDLAH